MAKIFVGIACSCQPNNSAHHHHHHQISTKFFFYLLHIFPHALINPSNSRVWSESLSNFPALAWKQFWRKKLIICISILFNQIETGWFTFMIDLSEMGTCRTSFHAMVTLWLMYFYRESKQKMNKLVEFFGMAKKKKLAFERGKEDFVQFNLPYPIIAEKEVA